MKAMRMIMAVGALSLSACSGFAIVASSDPLVKLNQAANLYEHLNRPLPAESLIQEAMAIYQKRDDAHGLATANREYADFLKSPAVADQEIGYRKHGFVDRSITFDNRLEKAAELYSKALEFYGIAEKEELAAGEYDSLTNTYYNMGNSHWALNDNTHACVDYDRSLAAYEENMRGNPTAQPRGTRMGDVPQTLAAAKRRARCG